MQLEVKVFLEFQSVRLYDAEARMLTFFLEKMELYPS